LKKEDHIVENYQEEQTKNYRTGIPLKKPTIGLFKDDKDVTNEYNQKMSIIRKPIINLNENDNISSKLKKPIIGINNNENNIFDKNDDPLSRLREQRKQHSSVNTSKHEDKTVISNNEEEKEVKDNNGLFEKKSLMESMKEKIKFGAKSQITIEAELNQRFEKKTKPPR